MTDALNYNELVKYARDLKKVYKDSKISYFITWEILTHFEPDEYKGLIMLLEEIKEVKKLERKIEANSDNDSFLI